jgi:hypothetical protein
MLSGELKDLCRWCDLRAGWLQDRIPPWCLRGRRCLAGVAPGPILAGDQLPVLVLRGTEGLPLEREVAHLLEVFIRLLINAVAVSGYSGLPHFLTHPLVVSADLTRQVLVSLQLVWPSWTASVQASYARRQCGVG